MELKEQQYVLAIARYRNIKDAAQELCLTSSALSVYLSSLERQIGARLFDRIGKQFVPTEAGRLYIRRASQILEIRNCYEEEFKHLKQEISGTVRFGIHPRRTLYLLAPAVTDFCGRYPEVEVIPQESTSEEMVERLADGTLDFAVTNYRQPGDGFTWTPMYQDRLVVVLAADHPAGNQARTLPGSSTPWLDLGLLREERFILQKPFQSSFQYASRALEYARVTPKKVFTIENLETASQMAAEGFGAAFNLERFARHFSYHKPIRYFLAGDPEEKISYYIACNPRKYQPGYVKEFMETLIFYGKGGTAEGREPSAPGLLPNPDR